jgi:glucans biosynthesis protein
MNETTSPAGATALPGADQPTQQEELMGLCLLQWARYMQQLGGEPTADEVRAMARPRRPAPEGAGPPAGPQVCGARRRDGSICQRPPVEGRRRCRSHGCAPNTGAPKGNRNALKHGCFTAVEMARRRRINDFIRECNATLKQVDEEMKGCSRDPE